MFRVLTFMLQYWMDLNMLIIVIKIRPDRYNE